MPGYADGENSEKTDDRLLLLGPDKEILRTGDCNSDPPSVTVTDDCIPSSNEPRQVKGFIIINERMYRSIKGPKMVLGHSFVPNLIYLSTGHRQGWKSMS